MAGFFASLRGQIVMKTALQAFLKDKMRMLLSITMLLTGASYLSGVHRYLELVCHFRMQYMEASLFFLTFLALMRDWRWSVVAAACLILNGAAILPWYIQKPSRSEADGTKIRVLLSNVFTENRNSGALLSVIAAERPDVLVLQEVDDYWMHALEPLTSSFPFSISIPRSDNFGIAVFSRIPFTQVDERPFGVTEVPSIAFDLKFIDEVISFVATHPLPPVRKEAFAARNAQLSAIAAFARQSPNPVVVIGDLNVTMWSAYYSSLIRDSGLRDCRKGFGVVPTWPTNMPFLRIPLDHCLLSRTIGVSSVRAGKNIGSDHLPLIVDLLIPRSHPTKG